LLRISDAWACVALAVAWMITAHFTAAYDAFFALTFALNAFFLFTATSLTGRRGAALLTALAAGLLSVNTASVSGHGYYKLLLFAGAGLVFEAVNLTNREGRPFWAAFASTASMPFMLWVLSGAETTLLKALPDALIIASAAGLFGAAVASLMWSQLAHTKAAIRFRYTDSAGSAAELKKLMKRKRRGKRF